MIHDIRIDNSTIFYTKEATAIDDPAMVKLDNVQLKTYER